MSKIVKPPRPRIVEVPLGASSAGWHQIEEFATGCPKAYQFAKVRKLRKRGQYIPEPLSVGLYLHAARAQWLHDNRKGELWREAMISFGKRYEALTGPKLSPASFTAAVTYFEGYSAFWRTRPTTQVLAVEYELSPRVIAPGAPEWAKRSARLDSVEQWRGRTWIGEFKSTSSSAKRVQDFYSLHGQILLQMSLWGPEEETKFGPLAGVLLDVIVKGNSKTPAKGAERIPIPIERCAAALKWFKKDFATWIMQSSMIDWDARPERRPLCQRAYGACDFREICLRGRDGSGAFVLENGDPVHTWKPSPGKSVPPWD